MGALHEGFRRQGEQYARGGQGMQFNRPPRRVIHSPIFSVFGNLSYFQEVVWRLAADCANLRACFPS
jgi:hypothetical protein